MSKPISELQFLHSLSKIKELIEGCASKAGDNLFLGGNIFANISLLSEKMFVNTGGILYASGYANGNFTGARGISTHSEKDDKTEPVHIAFLRLRVIDSLSIGDTVSDLTIVEVKKNNTYADDVIGETIYQNDTFYVENDEQWGKVINVQLNKTYTEDTYFLIKESSNRYIRECWYAGDPSFVISFTSNSMPNKGEAIGTLSSYTQNGWTMSQGLVGASVDIAEAIKNQAEFMIGEYKTLSYDQQDSFILGGRTWLKCDGRAVSKSDYDSLYNILGNTFGESADTFNLPNNQSQGYLYICAK